MYSVCEKSESSEQTKYWFFKKKDNAQKLLKKMIDDAGDQFDDYDSDCDYYSDADGESYELEEVYIEDADTESEEDNNVNNNSDSD